MCVPDDEGVLKIEFDSADCGYCLDEATRARSTTFPRLQKIDGQLGGERYSSPYGRWNLGSNIEDGTSWKR